MSGSIYQTAGQQWGVDPLLLQAMAQVETGDNPAATSSAGAQGNMQLMPATAASMGVANARVPGFAVPGAAKMLHGLLTSGPTKGNVALTLRYYQGGPDRSKWGPVNAAYPAKVAAAYARLKAAAGSAPPVYARANPATMSPEDLDKALSAGTAPAAAAKTPATMSDQELEKALAGAPEAAGVPGQSSNVVSTPSQLEDALTPRPPAATAAPRGSASLETGYADARSKMADVGHAAAEGFRSADILTPEARAANDRTAVGRWISNPLATVESLPLKVGNALMLGGSEAVHQITGIPARDVNMLMQVAPVAHAPFAAAADVPMAAQMRGIPAPSPDVPQPTNLLAAPTNAPAFVPPGAVAPKLPRILELIRADDAVAANRPSFIPPTAATTPEGVSVPIRQPPNPLAASQPRTALTADSLPDEPLTNAPRSLSAASSREQTLMPLPGETPGQIQANLMKSVTQTAADRAGPREVDNTVYVPGTERTLAAREFTPQNAVAEKTLRETDQAFDARLKAIEKSNNEAMVDYFHAPEGVGAGDPIALEKLEQQRDAMTPPALELFKNEKPVDAAPVVKEIDRILASPSGKRGAVVSVLNDVKSKLFNQDGELETSPSQLYGARQNITDLLRKGRGTSEEASNVRLAKAELENVLGVLDPVIGAGAPGFEKYLQDYSAASRPIEAMRFLQNQIAGPGKLTDSHGVMQYNRVQKLLETIAKQRAARGPQPAKSLTDAQVQGIVNLRNELAANSYKDQLARTKGSDTAQKTNAAGVLGSGPIGSAVKGAGSLAAHALLATTTHGVGNALYHGYMGILRPARQAAKAQEEAAALADLKNRLASTAPPGEAAP